MPRQVSGNHKAAAFSLPSLPSSQNASTRLRSFSVALSKAWAPSLVLWILISSSPLADPSAFARVSWVLDRPSLAWFELGFGYLCIAAVSLNLRQRFEGTRLATPSIVLSVMAFSCFSYHLLLLRWPWLTGSTPPGTRYTVWSEVLSSTWQGVPVLAFGEMLTALVLVTHGLLVASATAPWERLGRATSWGHVTRFVVGLVACVLACALVVALATGRR